MEEGARDGGVYVKIYEGCAVAEPYLERMMGGEKLKLSSVGME